MIDSTYKSINPVRKDADKVMDKAEHVNINTDNIVKLSNNLINNYEFNSASWDAPVFPAIPESDFETVVDFFIVGNAINYCFNDLESGIKFSTNYLGTEWKGSFGLWASLKRALDNNIQILDAEYLQDITKNMLRSIFDSTENTSMPMIESRVENLRIVGKLMEDLGGSFSVLFKDNVKIYGEIGVVEQLVNSDAFKDERTYDGETIRFDKRAQLAVCMIYGKCLHTEYEFVIGDEDSFTIFADYGIPAGLVAYGVLEYSDSLQEQINNNKLIPENSNEEVEIRAATVISGKLIQKQIKKQTGMKVGMVVLDYLLWQMRNDANTNAHITETTAY